MCRQRKWHFAAVCDRQDQGQLPGIGGDPLVLDNKTRVPHSGARIIKIKMDVTMRIPTSSRYGVRALADLAYHGGGQPTLLKDICKRQKLSQRYLEQIFHKLLKAGLLKSKRGPQGGYMLSKDPSEITVLDIVTATQGPIVPVACLNEKKRKCEVFPLCVTWHIWKETQNLLVEYWDSVTLADLCASASEHHLPRELNHKFMYSI